MDGVPRPPYDAVDLAYAVNGFQRAANDLTAVLAAADRLAEAVERWRIADGDYIKANGSDTQAHALSRAESDMIRALADYRRIREGNT